MEVASYEPRPPRQYDESIPKPLDRICQKAMAKLASERYESAFDMAEDLWHFLASIDASRDGTTGLSHPHSQKPFGHSVETENHASKEHSGTTSHDVVRTSETESGESPESASHATFETSSGRGIAIVPKGIRCFDAHDSDFYLELVPVARDRCGLPDSIRFWKTRLEEVQRDKTFPVGLIYGPSGCGKSSFIQAGLLPRLSSSIHAVFVEATAEDTEQRLLSALQTQCPTLPRDQADEYAWFASNSLGIARNVRHLPLNGFGIFDIHGNVWEFPLIPNGLGSDGIVSNACSFQLRGGAVNSGVSVISLTSETSPCGPDYVSHNYGFRLAKSLPID
ncbi:MAG: hypothetical protein KDB00_15170 [Planctomycetales bacterium]|nr:hypothetical protein [Planctomycetales bacterium]